VQQGKEIDWFDLCNEAGFSPAVVWDINDAKAKAEEAMNEPLGQRLDEFGLVPVQCGPHVRHLPLLLVLFLFSLFIYSRLFTSCKHSCFDTVGDLCFQQV